MNCSLHGLWPIQRTVKYAIIVTAQSHKKLMCYNTQRHAVTDTVLAYEYYFSRAMLIIIIVRILQVDIGLEVISTLYQFISIPAVARIQPAPVRSLLIPSHVLAIPDARS